MRAKPELKPNLFTLGVRDLSYFEAAYNDYCHYHYSDVSAEAKNAVAEYMATNRISIIEEITQKKLDNIEIFPMRQCVSAKTKMIGACQS
jgi:hypothetical protein